MNISDPVRNIVIRECCRLKKGMPRYFGYTHIQECIEPMCVSEERSSICKCTDQLLLHN